MGLFGFLTEKIITGPPEPIPTTGFTAFKFVAVTTSIAFLLFGAGYMFSGIGRALKPVSDIVDELHDDTSSDSDESSESSNSSNNSE